MSEELADTIKEMYLSLSKRAMAVGMLPDELPLMIMSRLEFEYKFLPRLVKTKMRLASMFWLADRGYYNEFTPT